MRLPISRWAEQFGSSRSISRTTPEIAVGLDDWLLFLGAGASRPSPTNLPPFAPLSWAVLNAIGWETRMDDDQPSASNPVQRWQFKYEPHYPDIAHFDMAPEVLFGTLNRFGVRFAAEVCQALSDAKPNAIHEVAAQVLKAGGCVWTPNIDDAVEQTCGLLGFQPHRTGRPLLDPDNPLDPLSNSGPGSYVKFHGTVEAPSTLAFTDRQLIAPLSEADVDALAQLAVGKVVVFYGYAGADADLAELLDRVLATGREIHWFEPSEWSHDLILQAFPVFKDRINFVPSWTSDEAPDRSLSHTGSTFLRLAAAAGHTVDAHLAKELVDGHGELRKVTLPLRRPSGATQARLVERFGVNDPDDDKRAWTMAWKDDLRHLRVRTIPEHARHHVSYSLYHIGSVASLVRWLADRRDLLRRIWPRRLRNYLITRACALRLREHDWSRLRDFVDWAAAFRSDAAGNPSPSDLYYQAQAYRYSLLPADARTSADRAIEGLQNIADAERLAGALYEAGDAALYQADFNAALGYAFQLRYRRGRYAIPRWQAWGGWLETVALAHLGRIEETTKPLEATTELFEFERDPFNRADARTAELLVARVRLAQTGSLGLDSLDHPTDAVRPGRYRDDLDLLRADISIALGDHEDAQRRLERVRGDSATPISLAWAHLGLAELERLHSPANPKIAAGAFRTISDYAHERGATWLEAQAVLGVHLCGDPCAEEGWQRLAATWPPNGGVELERLRATPADPARVLWMVTL